jgi:hypothetical protein
MLNLIFHNLSEKPPVRPIRRVHGKKAPVLMETRVKAEQGAVTERITGLRGHPAPASGDAPYKIKP